MTLTSPQSIWIVVVAVVGVIKLALEAGKATPAPPVGPALGSKGVNIMAFCKDYNARTADKPGYVIPVEITVFDVCSFLPLSLISSLIINFLLNLVSFKSCSFYMLVGTLQDKSFTFILKTPPASVLLLKAAGTFSTLLLPPTCLMLSYIFTISPVISYYCQCQWGCSEIAIEPFITNTSLVISTIFHWVLLAQMS